MPRAKAATVARRGPMRTGLERTIERTQALIEKMEGQRDYYTTACSQMHPDSKDLPNHEGRRLEILNWLPEIRSLKASMKGLMGLIPTEKSPDEE